MMATHPVTQYKYASAALDCAPSQSERTWVHRHDLELKPFRPQRKSSTWLALGAGGILLGAITVLGYSQTGNTTTEVMKEAPRADNFKREAVLEASTHKEITVRPPLGTKAVASEEKQSDLAFTVIPAIRPASTADLSASPNRIQTVSAKSLNGVSANIGRCAQGCAIPPLQTATAIPIPIPAPQRNIRPQAPEIERSNFAFDSSRGAVEEAGYFLGKVAALPLTSLQAGAKAAQTVAELAR
jgi:hypothetical protein